MQPSRLRKSFRPLILHGLGMVPMQGHASSLLTPGQPLFSSHSGPRELHLGLGSVHLHIVNNNPVAYALISMRVRDSRPFVTLSNLLHKMRAHIPTALCLLLSRIAGSTASSLATFQDSECKKSANTLTGENGYPDGVCTKMVEVAQGAYQSFMFITLDDGCTRTLCFHACCVGMLAL